MLRSLVTVFTENLYVFFLVIQNLNGITNSRNPVSVVPTIPRFGLYVRSINLVFRSSSIISKNGWRIGRYSPNFLCKKVQLFHHGFLVLLHRCHPGREWMILLISQACLVGKNSFEGNEEHLMNGVVMYCQDVLR